jgi:hypothetical protein
MNTNETQFDRDLVAARNRSIANLRQAADHRRVEQLARHIHASLQGESRANSMLAITRVLGVWLRSMSPNVQIIGIAIVTAMVTQEITGPDDHAA